MVKSSKRQAKNTTGMLIMPDLNPRDTDTKYTGGEPQFTVQPADGERTGALVTALNWYSRYFDRKVAKEQFAAYADYNGDKETARRLQRADDRSIHTSVGWLARLSMRGLQLTETERSRIGEEIQRLLATQPVKEKTEEKEAAPKVNVQEVMRERARDAAGELEGLLDEFTVAGAKAADATPAVVGLLSERNLLPQHIPYIAEIWRKKSAEFTSALEASDKQLVEGYSQYSKHQLKALVKFSDAVLSGLDSYINVKRAAKTPRRRKAVSPEKQAAKIKFLKAYPELGLTSIHPAKILGSTEVWAYDTVKRKLWYLVADSHVGTLGIKGSTILGFDTAKSGVKTLRKPAETLKKLIGAGKPASRKLFTDINAVHAQPNGRSNSNLVFLKVY